MAATRGYNFDWASMDGDYDLMTRMQQDMPILFEGFRYHADIRISCAALTRSFPFKMCRSSMNRKLRSFGNIAKAGC